MVKKLTRLPAETQEALQQFACLGNVAEITMLSIVLGTSEEEVHEALWPSVRQELVGLASVGYKELKKTGAFLLPGFAKFVVIKKSATKERAGINPFTKEPTVFKAKPARKIVRARPVKAAKDAV